MINKAKLCVKSEAIQSGVYYGDFYLLQNQIMYLCKYINKAQK